MNANYKNDNEKLRMATALVQEITQTGWQQLSEFAENRLKLIRYRQDLDEAFRDRDHHDLVKQALKQVFASLTRKSRKVLITNEDLVDVYAFQRRVSTIVDELVEELCKSAKKKIRQISGFLFLK